MGKSKSSRSKPTQSDDLISIDNPNDKSIVAHLSGSFNRDCTYFRIGESILLSLNPGRPLEQNSDSNAKTIGSAVKDGKDRQAHVFELAANAYFNMKTDKEDQSIIFL
jgi:myosin heavy subunit